LTSKQVARMLERCEHPAQGATTMWSIYSLVRACSWRPQPAHKQHRSVTAAPSRRNHSSGIKI